MHCSPIHAKQIQKAIEKSTKQVIATSPLKISTRSGSKELAHFIKQLAHQPSANLATAAQMGEILGHRIVELSQKMGREHLDQGVIRNLSLKQQVPDWAAPPTGAASGEEPVAEKVVPEESAIVSKTVESSESQMESAIEANSDLQINGNLTLLEPVEAEAFEENLAETPDENLGDENLEEDLDEDEEDLDEDEEDEEDLDEEDLGEDEEENLDEEDLDEDEEDLDEEDEDELGEDEEEDLDEDEEDLDGIGDDLEKEEADEE